METHIRKGCHRPNFRRRGFTLIEAMVAAAIIALLAASAYPSYRHAVRKAKRAEARTALMQLMQQQERHYMLHTRYVAFSADSTDPDASRFKWYSGDSAATSAYEISGVACAGESLRECILLTAIAGSARVDRHYDDPYCRVLSLSSTGVKLPSGRDCW